MRVERVDPVADPRWDAYVEGHPDGLVYHHSGWLRSLQREYPGAEHVALVATGDGGEVAGVLPLQWTAGLPLGPRGVVGRRLASLPRTPVAGPLADSDEVALALLDEAVRCRGDGPALQVKLHAPLAAAPAGAAIHPWRETFAIDLPEREDDVRFGASRNHSRIRWAVNKARRDGLRVRETTGLGDVQRWYPLYLEALRFNAVPPRPLRLFEAIFAELGPRGLATLILAEDRDGRALAGAVVLELGATAFYAFNGVRRAALDLRPNDLVQWEAIHRAVRCGRRHYDLGEVVERNAGLADFKRKWGAQPRRLERLYHPAPDAPPDPGAGGGAVRAAAEHLYQRLPLRLTAAVGERLYRYL